MCKERWEMKERNVIGFRIGSKQSIKVDYKAGQ
jgi:hypothetical protein